MTARSPTRPGIIPRSAYQPHSPNLEICHSSYHLIGIVLSVHATQISFCFIDSKLYSLIHKFETSIRSNADTIGIRMSFDCMPRGSGFSSQIRSRRRSGRHSPEVWLDVRIVKALHAGSHAPGINKITKRSYYRKRWWAMFQVCLVGICIDCLSCMYVCPLWT